MSVKTTEAGVSSVKVDFVVTVDLKITTSIPFSVYVSVTMVSAHEEKRFEFVIPLQIASRIKPLVPVIKASNKTSVFEVNLVKKKSCTVGCEVGVLVGSCVGNGVGLAVGSCVGNGVGLAVVGLTDGMGVAPNAVGPGVGSFVGLGVGFEVGLSVGIAVGCVLGCVLGCTDGRLVLG